MQDDIAFLTNDEKRSVAYGLCVLGTAATGATFGSLAGGQTILGAIGGAVVGLVMCTSVQEPLKEKLFSTNTTMSELEFLSLARQIKQTHRNLTRSQVFDVIAAARLDVIRNGPRYASFYG